MVLHLACALAVVASGAHAIQEIFRATRVFSVLPAALMSVEVVLIFQWGLYYATRSATVRRIIHRVLWLHVVLTPLLVAVLLSWPTVLSGKG